MDLTLSIKSAENQFKQILEAFFVSVYNENKLPSHGLEHHRRVWLNAKDLLIRLPENKLPKDPHFISSLLIASYMHDLGMVTDPGPRHGRCSQDFCRTFLDHNKLKESDFPGLLKAILDHDKKDYSEPDGLNLQTLLSVADDLDAFGYIGIYRYIEIYLLRGIKRMDLASAIRENAKKRYNHFEELFRTEETLISIQSERYRILDNFFNNYDLQLNGAKENSGYVKIVNILYGMVKNNTNMDSLIRVNEKSCDKIISGFFTNLKSELTITTQ
jgi:HD superfamily phosphodiesterase